MCCFWKPPRSCSSLAKIFLGLLVSFLDNLLDFASESAASYLNEIIIKLGGLWDAKAPADVAPAERCLVVRKVDLYSSQFRTFESGAVLKNFDLNTMGEKETTMQL